MCICSVKVKALSCVRLFAIPWTVAYHDPQSMEFPRQGYWSRLPFPSPGDLPNPGIKPGSPALQANALPSESLVLILVCPWEEVNSRFPYLAIIITLVSRNISVKKKKGYLQNN